MTSQQDLLKRGQRGTDDEWSPFRAVPENMDAHAPEHELALRLTAKLGFRNFLMGYRLVVSVGPPVQVYLHNWPEEWHTRYWSLGYLRIDPVVAQILVAYRPFSWDELPAPSPVQKAFFEDAAQHGFVDGVSGTVRFGSDEAGFFSVSCDRPMDGESKEAAMAAMLLLTARSFESVRLRVLASRNLTPVRLTNRQCEALRGVMLGRSLIQSSESMGISVSALTNHLGAARRKLGERNNKAAVHKAVAMNLLLPFGPEPQNPSSRLDSE